METARKFAVSLSRVDSDGPALVVQCDCGIVCLEVHGTANVNLRSVTCTCGKEVLFPTAQEVAALMDKKAGESH